MFMKSKGIERFSILGHSLGAYTGCHFTSKYPDLVEDLFLVSPGGMNAVLQEHEGKVKDMIKDMPLLRRLFVSKIVNDIFQKKVEHPSINDSILYLNLKSNKLIRT